MRAPSPLAADPFRIDWNRHSPAQWQAMLAECERPTLPQSPAYAAAIAAVAGTAADMGLIRFHGRPIGMMIVTRPRSFGGASSHRLYRGPLWIHEEIPGEMLKLLLRRIRRRYRWWRGRPLLFHPELADTPAHRRILADAGFRRVGDGYATIWLDLSASLAALRAGMRGRWRNRLNQAERNAIEVVAADDDGQYEWLYRRHADHMARHGYRGPSPALLRALRARGGDGRFVELLIARHAATPVAALLLTRHGRSATYLVGWTGAEGRRLRAQNLLLWQAVSRLKADGVRWFDLGGIDAAASGVVRFKQGIGGEAVSLVGGYV